MYIIFLQYTETIELVGRFFEYDIKSITCDLKFDSPLTDGRRYYVQIFFYLEKSLSIVFSPKGLSFFTGVLFL